MVAQNGFGIKGFMLSMVETASQITVNNLSNEIINDIVAIGQEMLTAIEENPDLVNIVLRHHENYDGTGYPGQLKGDAIPIEQRPAEEVTGLGGTRVVPEGVPVMNPAFDVTPARLVHAIITDRGVARAPYTESLKALFDADQA